MSRRLAVVGGDAGGMSAAAYARRRDPSLEIVAFERGPYASYSACGIPYYVGGVIPEAADLIARTPERFRADGIDVRVGWEVVAIDLAARELTARAVDGSGGETVLGFDELMYATGADAVVPPIPGAAEATEPLKSIPAAERFRAQLASEDGARAVVVGAGYIGLEIAEALTHRGCPVVLVEAAPHVFGTVDADMAEHIQRAAEGVGIDVRTGVRVQAIEHDGGRPRAVVTDAGTIEADHVVVAVGVKPAVELARAAGLPIGEATGAVATDDRQRAGDGVYAAGDCVESWHRLLERPVHIALGTHANKQGRVAGANLTGDDGMRFPGVIGTAISRICSVEVARTGLSEREAADAGIDVAAATIDATTTAQYYPDAEPIHVKVLAERSTGRLLGGQIVGGRGAGKRIDTLATAIWSGMTAAELSMLDLSYAPPFSPVFDPVQVAARQASRQA